MKTFAAVAALAVTSATVSAFDPEFLRGAQTGMFLQSEEQFEDYSCSPVQVDPKIQTYVDMAAPMKMMMQNMNKGEPNPMIDMVLDGVKAFGKISSIFDEDYDGGDFCKGLLFSKEASKIVFKIGNSIMNKKQEEAHSNQLASSNGNNMGAVQQNLNKKNAHFQSRK